MEVSQLKLALSECYPERGSTLEEIQILVDLIWRWNKRFKLTAARSIEELVEEHVVDSVYFGARLPPFQQLIEIGSGMGLPGLLLAIFWPDRDFYLIEPRERAAAFLNEAILKLNFNHVKVIQRQLKEIDHFHDLDPENAIGVARAFSPISRLGALLEQAFPKGFRLFVAGGIETRAKVLEDASCPLRFVEEASYHPFHVRKRSLEFCLS